CAGVGETHVYVLNADLPGAEIRTAVERQCGWAAGTHDHFDLAPGDPARVCRSGEGLECGLFRRKPGGEMHRGPRARARVRHFGLREETREGALALRVNEALDAGDVHEINAEAEDHGISAWITARASQQRA